MPKSRKSPPKSRSRLRSQLRRRLDSAESVVVLSAGSRLRGDDSAGHIAAEKLARLFKKTPPACPVTFIDGDTAPENYTGAIRACKASHLVFLDASDFGKEPGFLKIVGSRGGISNPTFSTHNPSMKLLIRYIEKSIGTKVTLVGIQAGSTEFGTEPSKDVVEAAHELAEMLAEAILT